MSRDELVSFRVSAAQKQLIEQAAEEMGYESVSDFCREMSLVNATPNRLPLPFQILLEAIQVLSASERQTSMGLNPDHADEIKQAWSKNEEHGVILAERFLLRRNQLATSTKRKPSK